MSLIPMFFKDAVVPIGIKQYNGGITWIGTGFFVTRQVGENQFRPFLITNRHVFEGKTSITISMKERDSDSLKMADAHLVENERILYIGHSNKDIDIVVLPLNAKFIIDNNLQFPSFNIDENAMTSSELRKNGVDEGSLVYMLGFTMGLVNEGSSVPICRLGCIARMSEAQVKQQNNFLIDIQNFPGNSGSPIITRPELISIKGSKSLDRSVLIGVIHSYIPYNESLINSQTGNVVEIRSENSGIAYVHPVEFIREIIDGIVKRYIPEEANR